MKLPMKPQKLFSLLEDNEGKDNNKLARLKAQKKTKTKSLVLMVNEMLKYAGEEEKEAFANGITHGNEDGKSPIDERLKEIYQLEQQRKTTTSTSQEEKDQTTMAAIDSAINQMVVSSTTKYDEVEGNDDDTTPPPRPVLSHCDDDKKEEDGADATEVHHIVMGDDEGRNKRRSSGSNRRRSSTTSSKQRKKATRDKLIDLITKELANCWTDPDDATAVELLEAEISAEDLFYAQMNGENIDHVLDDSARSGETKTAMKRIETFDACCPTSRSIAEYCEGEFNDHTSFAGLELPAVLQAVEDSGEFTTTSSGSRSSSENGMISRSSTVKIKDIIMKHMMDQANNEPSASSTDDDCLEISSRTKQAWLGMFDDMLEVVDKTPRQPRRTDSINSNFDGDGRCEEKEEDPTEGPSQFEDPPAEHDHDDDDRAADEVVSGNVSVVSDITDFTPFVVVDPAAKKKKSSKNHRQEEMTSRRMREGESERNVPTKRASTNTASTSSMSANSEQSRRKVNFSNVEVRYYDRVLDINPAVTSGASVGLGWRYKKGGKISINDWQHGNEEVTGGDKLRRRATYGLVMPKTYRESLLREWGYTQQDIAKATRVIRHIKHNRKLTVQQLPNQHMEEAVENAARKVKNLLKSFGGGAGVGMNNKKR